MRKLWLNCSSPLIVHARRLWYQIPCGRCVQCRVSKQQELASMLQIEEYASKYCVFVTLTYDDAHIPALDFRNFVSSKVRNDLNYSSHVCVPLQNDSSLPKNVVADLLENGEFTFSNSELRHYNFRRHLYIQRYPSRHLERSIAYQDNVVPIVYAPDIQKFIKRLRQRIKRKYDEKIRYYAVSEYGSNGLRPHFHILLFFNSPRLAQEFRKVHPTRTRQDGKQLEVADIIASCWRYGVSDSAFTDKSAYSYVASYVNGHADFPSLLARIAPQKAYHSTFLGEYRSKETLQALFQKKNFAELTTLRYVTEQRGISVEKTLPACRSVNNRFLPKFTGSDSYDVQDLYSLLTKTLAIVDRVDQIEAYSIDFMRRFRANQLDDVESQIVGLYGPYLNNSVIVHSHSAVLGLFYAAKRFRKLAVYFGTSIFDYLIHYAIPFQSYLKLKALNEFYASLELDPTAAQEYYSSFDERLGILDFKKYSVLPSFKLMETNAHSVFDKSVKHLAVAESYKF